MDEAVKSRARRNLRLGIALGALVAFVAELGTRTYRAIEEGGVAQIGTRAERVVQAVQSWSQGTHDEHRANIVFIITFVPLAAAVLGAIVWFVAFPLVLLLSAAIHHVAFRSTVDRQCWRDGTYAVCNAAPVLVTIAAITWWALA